MTDHCATIQDRPRHSVRQLTACLRGRVLSGDWRGLPTPLPVVDTLVQAYGVKRWAVDTALRTLAKEGLVERVQHVGTFVTGTAVRIRTVGVYLDSHIWQSPYHGFSRLLLTALEQQAAQLGVTLRLFAADLPGLLTALRERQVQALIEPVPPGDGLACARLAEGLPRAVFCEVPAEVEGAVHPNWDGMLELVSGAWAARGIKRAGVVSYTPRLEHHLPKLQCQAGACALEVRPEWVLTPETPAGPGACERFGYQALRCLLAAKDGPEAVFVHGEHCSRGAVTACYEHTAVAAGLHLTTFESAGEPLPSTRPQARVVLAAGSVAAHLLATIVSLGGGVDRQPWPRLYTLRT